MYDSRNFFFRREPLFKLGMKLSLILMTLHAVACNQPTSGKSFVEDLKKEHEGQFQAIQQDIDKRNRLRTEIETKIRNKRYEEAQVMIDSLFINQHFELSYLYTGMIFESKMNYPEALKEYDYALKEDELSIARSARARVYRKLNQPDKAIQDYRKMYIFNRDYALDIASVYEDKNQLDSALFYYEAYLERNPENSNIQKQVVSLKKKISGLRIQEN